MNEIDIKKNDPIITLRIANNEQVPSLRLADLAKAEKLLLQDMPVTPIAFQGQSFLVNPHVQGLFYSSTQEYYDLKSVILSK